MATNVGEYAYCTLITRASYLAGVVLLAHSMRRHGSVHPLIVLYTPNLPASSVRALELEASRSDLILHQTEALLPRDNIHVHLIAARFKDTWTKLRVFALHETYPSLKTACYLDADMLCFKNPDTIFSLPFPGDDWIAANHACVCNLDKDPWAPEEWNQDNCAYTPLRHPSALTEPTPVTPQSRPTHHLLNSGMFLFRPSPGVWRAMLDFFNTNPLLGEFKFPDQDFLAEFFRGKWRSIGWQYNALKTMRYWHPQMWDDDSVVVLHYIVDKPWASMNNPDGTAGYLGRDGETHKWWWNDFALWRRERLADGSEGKELVALVEEQVDTGKGELSEDMRDIGTKVQAMAGTKKPGQDDAQTNGGVAGGRVRPAGLKGGSSQMIP